MMYTRVCARAPAPPAPVHARTSAQWRECSPCCSSQLLLPAGAAASEAVLGGRLQRRHLHPWRAHLVTTGEQLRRTTVWRARALAAARAQNGAHRVALKNRGHCCRFNASAYRCRASNAWTESASKCALVACRVAYKMMSEEQPLCEHCYLYMCYMARDGRDPWV